jgi:hypothetical protein
VAGSYAGSGLGAACAFGCSGCAFGGGVGFGSYAHGRFGAVYAGCQFGDNGEYASSECVVAGSYADSGLDAACEFGCSGCAFGGHFGFGSCAHGRFGAIRCDNDSICASDGWRNGIRRASGAAVRGIGARLFGIGTDRCCRLGSRRGSQSGGL